MSIASVTGKDTVKINGRILADFATGDVAVIEFPEDLAAVKTGKDGNSIYAFNYSGRTCTVDLRLLRGGSDDKYLNNLLALFKNNPSSFTLLTGEFIKNIGDGQGNIIQDIYILSGGVFKKNPSVKENVDADPEQAIITYNLVFTNSPRSIG